MTNILVCQAYERIVANAAPGTLIESLRSVEAVLAQRAYWRPDTIRVVLLAESHLHTPEEELEATIDLSPFGQPAAPTAYTRFVYCMGYGEDGLVQGRVENNRGTPQFWKLFHACVHGLDGGKSAREVLKTGTQSLQRRIANKIAVLQEMKRRGIWLVDASLVGVYIPGSKKFPPNEIGKAILASWEGYWREKLAAASPAHIICIGLGVKRTLQSQLETLFPGRFSAIEQPNARLSAARHEENLRHCADICRQFAALI